MKRAVRDPLANIGDFLIAQFAIGEICRPSYRMAVKIKLASTSLVSKAEPLSPPCRMASAESSNKPP
jgi:hypothetical protein